MSLKSERKSGTAKDPEGTRSRILDAALDVFSNKGYHEASVDEIVDRSSTSKGSVYFHFPNKQKLFLALVDKFADLLERRITEAIEGEAIGIARVNAALRACLETFGKYRPLAKILLVQAVGLGSIFESKRLEVHQRFIELIRQYLDEAIAEGRWTETLADIVHESNNCIGDCRGIARTSLDGINQSVESVPCVSFPNRQAAHEHGSDCPCGVVVSREDEQR